MAASMLGNISSPLISVWNLLPGRIGGTRMRPAMRPLRWFFFFIGPCPWVLNQGLRKGHQSSATFSARGGHKTMPHEHYQSCIDACEKCAEACESCARACQKEPNANDLARC